MLRLILIFIFGMFVAVGVLAIVLYHFFGVKGLIAFPFVMLALAWIAKWLIKSLVKRFALSLFGIKARALRGASMSVHSIKPVPKPMELEEEDPSSPGSRLRDATARQVAATGEEDEDEKDKKSVGIKSTERVDPKDYLELDVTITPKGEATNRLWEPSELILTSEKITSLADLEEKSIGGAHSVAIWNGSDFGPDTEDKYPGEQRLKIVFEVKPGAKSGWLCYYHEPIGRLELPVGTVDV